jgi:phage terminase small subunit
MTNPKQPTARQLKFFELKCQGYTNVKAAIEAGYSKKCPRRVADEIVKYKWYQDLMKKHVGKIEKKIEMNSEKIITELSHSAFFDPINIFDVETGAVKPIDQIPEGTRRAIASIEVNETFEFDRDSKIKIKTGEIKKIKFWDKPRCNELIGKNIGMFADKLKVDVSTPELTEALGKLLGATIK